MRGVHRKNIPRGALPGSMGTQSVRRKCNGVAPVRVQKPMRHCEAQHLNICLSSSKQFHATFLRDRFRATARACFPCRCKATRARRSNVHTAVMALGACPPCRCFDSDKNGTHHVIKAVGRSERVVPSHGARPHHMFSGALRQVRLPCLPHPRSWYQLSYWFVVHVNPGY